MRAARARPIAIVAALVLAASAAHAASVSLSREFVSVANPADPGPGDVVRLSVTVNAGPNEIEIEVYGDLLFEGNGAIAPLENVVTQTPLQSYGGSLDWILGLSFCSGSTCTMFNQLCCLGTATVSNTPLVISSVDFLITAPGQVVASWDEETFDFFGAPPSPAICVTCPIPEPATGSLLGVGLLALAAARRRPRA